MNPEKNVETTVSDVINAENMIDTVNETNNQVAIDDAIPEDHFENDCTDSLIQNDIYREWTINIESKSTKWKEVHDFKNAPENVKNYVENWFELDMDNIIEQKIGTSGRHLTQLLVQSCFGVFITANITYFITYALAQPYFYCYEGLDKTPTECSADLYCNNPSLQAFLVPKFISWSYEFGYSCSPSLVQLLKVIGIICAAFMTLGAYFIADYLDRITTIIICATITVVCGTIGYFITNVWVKMIFVSMFFTLPTLASGTYGHIINESTCSKSIIRKVSIAAYMIFYGMSGIVLSLMFYVIKDANNGFLLITLLNILPLPTLWFFCINGPKYWYRRGNVTKTLTSLVYIINKNGGELAPKNKYSIDDENDADFERLNKEKAPKKIVTVQEICTDLNLNLYNLEDYNVVINSREFETKPPSSDEPNYDELIAKRKPISNYKIVAIFQKKYLKTLVGFSAMALCDYILTIGSIFESASIHMGSIQLDVILMSSVQVGTYIIAMMFINKLPRIKTYNYCLLSLLLAVLIQLVFRFSGPFSDKLFSVGLIN